LGLGTAAGTGRQVGGRGEGVERGPEGAGDTGYRVGTMGLWASPAQNPS